jgi:hypothetical protein
MILVSFFLGLVIAYFIGVRKPLLLLGLAYPFGAGAICIGMFGVDMLGIPISAITGFSWSFLLIVVMLYRTRSKIELPNPDFIQIQLGKAKKSFERNWGILPVLAFLIYLLYGITVKAMLWPTAASDSIAGYDFLAKVIANEHTLNNSVFDKALDYGSVRLTYPPLIPINYAMAYMSGWVLPKIVNVLFILSSASLMLSLSNSVCKNWFVATFMTVFFLSTPEFLAMSALSLTNIPTTLYAGFGFIFIYRFFLFDKRPDFWAGVLLLSFGMWVRSEVILFALTGILLLLYKNFKNRNFRPAIQLSLAVFTPYVIWKVFLDYVVNASHQQGIRMFLFYDAQKIDDLVRLIKQVTFSTQYYGWLIIAFLTFCASLFLKFKRKENTILLGSIFFIWGLYVLLYYQMENEFGTGRISVPYITAGYKRGIFSFFPIMIPGFN